MWKKMLFRFQRKMKEYPGLTEKVTLAGPDVVADYRNKASNYDAEDWVKQSVLDADSIIGLYDVHSYPGQMRYVVGISRNTHSLQTASSKREKNRIGRGGI